jgi:hypothetical protein
MEESAMGIDLFDFARELVRSRAVALKENTMPERAFDQYAHQRADRLLGDYQRRAGALGEGWPVDVVVVALLADLREWAASRALPWPELLARAGEMENPNADQWLGHDEVTD